MRMFCAAACSWPALTDMGVPAGLTWRDAQAFRHRARTKCLREGSWTLRKDAPPW